MTNQCNISSMMSGWRTYVFENDIQHPTKHDIADYLISIGIDDTAFSVFMTENGVTLQEARPRGKGFAKDKNLRPGETVNKTPQANPTSTKPTPGKPTPGKPTPGKPTPGKSTPGKSTPGKPTPGKSTPGKPADATKTNTGKTDPANPGGSEKGKINKADNTEAASSRKINWYAKELSGFSKNELRAFIDTLKKLGVEEKKWDTP